MTTVRKVEIVTASLEIEHVLEVLDNEGVSGYTVIRDVVGRGSRGARPGDELTGALTNSYVMTACSAEEAERVVAAVRPILKRFGGVALVTDCQWVRH